MKKPSRFLRMLGVAGLMISLLAATIAPVAAQPTGLPDQDGLEWLFDLNGGAFRTGDNAIYYPWVANGENFGLGASRTSISVQNLEDINAEIGIFVGDGAGDFDLVTTAFLSPYAAKTFDAADLGIAEGSGAPVAVLALAEFDFGGVPDEDFPDLEPGEALVETGVILSKPEGVEGDFTQVVACVINDGSGNPVGFAVAAEFTFDGVTYTPGPAGDPNFYVDAFTQADLQDILEDAQDGDELINPFGGLNNDGDCGDASVAGELGETVVGEVAIGGVAKQAVAGMNLPMTTSADTAVSGYNALNGSEIFQFDEWYLPIVQTNCGPGGCWDTVIRVANLDNVNNAVTIRFFPADDGSGSLQTGFQIQELVNGGETWNVNLGDLVPEGWVGSAHIFSDGGVFAMADRYKVGYDMWITNTGSSADFENLAQVDGANGRYALFAPHVLMDYFGWNTGINVANLVNADNNISIQYFNTFGNATQVLNQRLAAHGMTYFYDPSVGAQDNNNQDVGTDPNAGVVGSAIIWSDAPVAAAVDATKYPETDPNGGADLFQATSYSATQNIFTWQAVPLVQKGSPSTGMGDTSGINIMNPNATAVTANVYFVNPSGFNAQNFGVSSVTIPGYANGFVYTMTQHNLPNGFVGAAQVVASQPVAAVSANVNYEVDGDGSAIFNAFNPCGFFRVSGECSFGDPFEPGGQSITKTFVDENGDGIPGVNFEIVSTSGDFPYQRDGVSGTDGSAMFSNVPVGTYELNVNTVPAQYVLPENPADTFVLSEGEDWVETNTLLWAQGFEKTVCVTGTINLDDDDEFVDCDVTLSGVDVVVSEIIGESVGGDPVVATPPVFTGQTGDDGSVDARLPVGDYLLCIYDADETAVTSNGETVIPDLDDELLLIGYCEEFDVVAGVTTELVNPVDIVEGVLNILVYSEELTDVGGEFERVGIEGVEVCLDGGPVCAETGADGMARFPGLTSGTYYVTVDSGDVFVAVESANGGLLTVDIDDVQQDRVDFTYSPTEDLAQDGWVDDVAGEGTFDLELELDAIGIVEKTVNVTGSEVTLDGVDVIIYASDGGVQGEIVFEGATVDGSIEANLFPGEYILCIFDADGSAVTGNGETVAVDLEATAALGVCDAPFTVVEGEVLALGNDVDILNAQLDIFFYETVLVDQVPVANYEVCLYVDESAGDAGGNPNPLNLVSCQTTDDTGLVAFENLPANPYDMFNSDTTTYTSVSAQASGSTVVLGVFPDGVDFSYDPTADLVQDGWSNDADNAGTIDLEVELEQETDLLVTTAAGAQVQLTESDCADTPGTLGGAAVLTGGDGEALFSDLTAGGTYCIEVFGADDTFAAESEVVLGPGGNTATVTVPAGFGVLAVTNLIDCDNSEVADYSNFELNNVGTLTTTVGDDPANTAGSPNVCNDNESVIFSNTEVYAAGGFVTLLAVNGTNDSGQAFFLLPNGNYAVSSGYLWDTLPNAYANNTVATATGDIAVDDDGTTVEWLLVQPV